MSEEDQRELQRLALLHLLSEAVSAGPFDWGKDLPTLAGRLMDTGYVAVDAARVLRDLVKVAR
jgi:hypothetical protein